MIVRPMDALTPVAKPDVLKGERPPKARTNEPAVEPFLEELFLTGQLAAGVKSAPSPEGAGPRELQLEEQAPQKPDPRSPQVAARKALVQSGLAQPLPTLAETKHNQIAPTGLASKDPAVANIARAPSVLEAAPQSKELRDVLAAAFPEHNSITEVDEGELAEESPRAAKAKVQSSDEFITLQSLPSKLRATPAQKLARQNYSSLATSPAEAAPQQKTASPLERPTQAKSQTRLTDSLPDQVVQPRLDLASLEQALGASTISELQAPALPTQHRDLPKIRMDGHITTGSMSRERLSSQTVLGLRSAVSDLQRQGGGEIQIRLKPESLGEIRLQVATRGSQVGIRIHAENPQAKQVLEQSLDSLRDKLGEQNLKLGHIEFSSGPSAQSNLGLGPIQVVDRPATDQTINWAAGSLPQAQIGDTSQGGAGRDQRLMDRNDDDQPQAIRSAQGLRSGARASQYGHQGSLNVLA